MARAKIADIEAKLEELEKLRGVLERLARSCRGKDSTRECPILDLLDTEDDHADG